MIGPLRTAWRLGRVGLHLSYGASVAACVYPFVGAPRRLTLKQRWSRQLLGMLGLRLHASGTERPAALHGLIVANHISWLDIFVINALKPAAFVCKAEVRAWPLIGWLCERTDTVFLERGNRNAARSTGQLIAAKLERGDLVAVFPEGTTSDGTELLRFRSALLQSAIDADSLVQPLALRYADAHGRPTTAAAYCGETSLWESLWAIASEPAIAAHVEVLPALSTRERSRSHLAETTRALIHSALAVPAAISDEALSRGSAFRPTAAVESA